MLDPYSLPPNGISYTYVDKITKEVIQIYVDGLRKHCLQVHLRDRWVNVPVSFATMNKLIDENSVNQKRVKKLIREIKHTGKIEPVIFCHDGNFTEGRPDVMLVDGHHRYVAAAMSFAKFIPAWIIPIKEWEPFRIKQVRNITADELLKAKPIIQPHWKKGG